MNKNSSDFGPKIIDWYNKNKRDLPWRQTIDPYKIWLSEIILQQTRVIQGLPYYLSFTSKFPTVFDLANADEEEVLKTWQGLGYYSRARNLHHTAQFIVNELNGNFPKKYSELLKLKGVGSYTAAAIASFSNNEEVAVLDGNVYRVLARFFNIDTDISSSKAKNEFLEIANELIKGNNPSDFNQAIMEFGALMCSPKKPSCDLCPLNHKCLAIKHNKVNSLPVKLKKTKITHRYINYLVFIDPDSNTILDKRTENGIWKNLYEFPNIEFTENKTFSETEQIILNKYKKEFKIKSIYSYNNKIIIHKLSHQHLHIRFWNINIENKINKGILTKNINNLPTPIIIHNFIDKFL